MLLRSRFHQRAKPAARDFPLTLDMHYHVISGLAGEIKGAGRTLWISSREIIFECERILPAGTELELVISWPALLEDRIGLQLWVSGCVLHTLSNGVTAVIRKYQFRTRALSHTAEAGMAMPSSPPPAELNRSGPMAEN